MPAADGISIIIPTAGRVNLVEALLLSIANTARKCPFAVEVILADSSSDAEKGAIARVANLHGAAVVPAPPHHPGLARNAGVAHARFDLLLFVDSDVTIAAGAIQAHYDALLAGADACAGMVEFTGHPSFAWRCVEAMQMMLPFRYPLIAETAPWAPTANISFRKDRFLSVGGFDPHLPPYGGEDVDLGFRFSDAGFRVQTSAHAVVRHSIETWAYWSQNIPRLASYGRADFYLIERHPARTYLDLPSPLFAFVLQVVLTIIAVPVVGFRSLLMLAAAVVTQAFCYAYLKKSAADSLSTHLAGPFLIALLDLGKWIEAFKNRRFRPIFVRLRYLSDIIEKDWREIWASAWGVYASMFVFVLVFIIELLFNRSR